MMNDEAEPALNRSRFVIHKYREEETQKQTESNPFSCFSPFFLFQFG